MKTYAKVTFPVENVRRYLEPGPIVLVSSRWRDETNIMTMGWHTVMELQPSRVGCYIWSANHSFELIRKSKECVINVPTADMASVVVGVGNTTGREVDKFETFGLTAAKAKIVDAPLISECYASFECRLADASMIKKHSFFIWDVVAAHVARRPKYPRTLHYTGDGVFMVSGEHINLRRQFRPENL